MDLDGQIKLGHLLFQERKCRTCGENKSLIDDFYKSKKGVTASCYSYECKMCTIRRILDKRKEKNPFVDWTYPDW